MAELKTKKNNQSVAAFLQKVRPEQKYTDSIGIVEMMKNISQTEPKMWGDSIVGFGDYHYRYPTGREGDWFKLGFSPRKQNLTLYILDGTLDQERLLVNLGKFTTGKSCLYIKKLADVDMKVLEEMIQLSWDAKKMGEICDSNK